MLVPAVAPDASTPTKHPWILPLFVKAGRIPMLKPMTTTPRIVESFASRSNAVDPGARAPERAIFRTALLAPIALVLVADPGCVYPSTTPCPSGMAGPPPG